MAGEIRKQTMILGKFLGFAKKDGAIAFTSKREILCHFQEKSGKVKLIPVSKSTIVNSKLMSEEVFEVKYAEFANKNEDQRIQLPGSSSSGETITGESSKQHSSAALRSVGTGKPSLSYEASFVECVSLTEGAETLHSSSHFKLPTQSSSLPLSTTSSSSSTPSSSKSVASPSTSTTTSSTSINTSHEANQCEASKLKKITQATKLWSVEETVVLLEEYCIHWPRVGSAPSSWFKKKSDMWEALSSLMASKCGTATKSSAQTRSRFEHLVRERKETTLHNKTSGNILIPTPFAEQMNRIVSLDDLIQPEVMRGVGECSYKGNAMPPDISDEPSSGQRKKSTSSLRGYLISRKEEKEKFENEKKIELECAREEKRLLELKRKEDREARAEEKRFRHEERMELERKKHNDRMLIAEKKLDLVERFMSKSSILKIDPCFNLNVTVEQRLVHVC